MSVDNQDPDTKIEPPEKPADLQAQIDAAVSEKLKDIKSRLDSVYAERDALKKQSQEMTDKLAAAERQRLAAEGKELEAAKLHLEEVQRKNAELEAQLVAATRDNQLQSMLASLPFRTEKARQQALREITSDLTRTSEGTWVTKTGTPVETFVKQYADDSENSYLFKTPTSSGGGSRQEAPNPNGSGKKSLFEMSQADVIKMAKEGKLRR